MPQHFRLPDPVRFPNEAELLESSDRALKNFRYVVGSINDDALKVWSDLWEQLNGGVTPGEMVLPEMKEGFQPECGWAEFLEKFWILKHYLDHINRFCQGTT